MTEKYKTKKLKVYSELRSEIIHGVVPPGTRLTIADIAKKYSVSEIPVREAVQLLIQESYLVSAPHTGLTVSIISEEDVRKTFELRIALESLAARLSTNNMMPNDLETLYRMVEQSKCHLDDLDFHAYWVCNQNFHSYIYQFCNNDRLIHIIAGLMQYSHRYPQFYICASQIEGSIGRHLEILHALSDHDDRLVEDLVRIHMIYGCRTVQQRVNDALQKLTDEEKALIR